MKKLFSIFTLFTLLIIAVPAYARSGNLGTGKNSGGVSITSRETHTGKPSSSGVGVGGSGDRVGSASLFSGDPGFGGGSYYGGGYWPILSPVYATVPGTFFNVILFAIYTGPFGLF